MMRGYLAVGLVQPKCKENVGGVLRASACYGAAFVAVSGSRFEKASTDTTKAWRHMPLLRVPDLLSIQPYNCQAVAVEFCDNSCCLTTFQHPERAFYIFGPEDGSIPSTVLEQCQHVVRIPTRHCMNLAATVNVVLYDREAKRHPREVA